MKSSHNFLLKYDGAALADNSMDVAQLAPSLIALSDALTGLNKIANNGDAKVSLQVKALNKGSFIIDLELAQDWISQVGSLLTGTGVTAYCNAYTIFSSVIEILMLKKWLAGQKADKIQVSENAQTVTFFLKTNTFTIGYLSYKGYKTQTINESCTQIAAPLGTEGIDTLCLSDTKQSHTFSTEDLPAINAASEDEVLTTNVAKSVLTIETAAFKDNAKWKVKIGEQNSVFVSIDDLEFLQRINEGIELFGKGHVLLVDLETKQTLSSGKIILQYTIKKVHEHKQSPEQLTMF